MVRRSPALLLAVVFVMLAGFSGLAPVPALAAEAPLAVNAGGTDYVASSGVEYSADPTLDPTVAFSGGRIVPVAGTITATDDVALYETVRMGQSIGFDAAGLAAGTYDVTLHFIEPDVTRVGARPVDVALEGVLVLDDYDAGLAAGGALIARVETFVVEIIDGELNITLTGVSERAVIAAVAVLPSTVVPAPLSLTPDTVAFGNVPPGETAVLSVLATNSGDSSVTIVTATSSDPVFSGVDPVLPQLILPGEAIPLSIAFAPVADGVFAGEVTLALDDPETAQVTVSVSGSSGAQRGEPVAVFTPAALDFGFADIGATESLVVAVDNAGTADLVLDQAVIPATEYAVSPSGPAVVPPGGSLLLTVSLTAASPGDLATEMTVTTNDLAFPSVTIPIAAIGSPFPAGSVAVLGCSNTDQHIAGYLEASTVDQLAAVHDLGGGSLDAWFTDERGHWSIYEANRPIDGYRAAWVQVCLRATDLVNDNEAQLTAVIDEIVLRDGDIPIIVSPINSYIEGHVCSSTGPDGPAAAAALADWAAENLGAVRGPDTGPLAPEQLVRDGCHLNDAGIQTVGAQLAAFFDPA